ncbi:alpha/beta fold hydrolase [Janthinobacterium agaricidamnosum]|uniref:Alpha/beta hydrolase fold family protein n=1 Tax=Janthinobacterium agaricidamnosum NBRC 102515 = DSM 9628 TaxID=1349767 RepID=W0V516_9BURK|nr:alpha/beta hydrolase [Janthinobacterium agaricidamnosum]CDG82946.1 alpha/beta hydrolase fold family protein [Janthinobacterium agaricidamnosum NBRC 102515 = DSM 9628]
MATLSANGMTIAYDTHGDPRDPAVLLIMGLGMQLISWPIDLVDGLVEQGLYVIRYDHRDAGLSTKLDQFGTPNLPLLYIKNVLGWKVRSAYTLYDMADDALGLLDGLKIRQAHLIGVSMGGMIAQVMAARFPRRTLSLTSIMSSSGRRGLPGPAKTARKALLSRPKNPLDREQVIAHMARSAHLIGSPAYPTPDRVMRQHVEQFLTRGSCPAGMARQMAAIAASGQRTGLLKTITCPSMVIHGMADPLIPAACGIDTAALIPGADLHLIEGMGHDLPAQLIERLLALIDGHLHGKMAAQSSSQIAQS